MLLYRALLFLLYAYCSFMQTFWANKHINNTWIITCHHTIQALGFQQCLEPTEATRHLSLTLCTQWDSDPRRWKTRSSAWLLQLNVHRTRRKYRAGWCLAVQGGGGVRHLPEIAEFAAPADMRLLRASFSRENVRRKHHSVGAERLPPGGKCTCRPAS